MQKPGWYWNRIKCMSPGEVMYRVRNQVLISAQRSGYCIAAKVSTPAFPIEPVPCWIHDKLNIGSTSYLEKANAVAEGRMACFAIEDARLGANPIWNRDPLTGKEAPLRFGKKLDYRDENLVGDIKYLWEINRHLQLVTLAQAYKLSNEARYLDVLKKQLASWFVQCPYLKGPNWASSLELAIRLINWSIVWQLIGGKGSPIFEDGEDDKFLRDWLTSIYQHVHFIRNNYSRYSSANNHLIGEAAGLYIATTTWPFWNEFAEWRNKAQEMLEEEALLQNAPDGVNREQAVSYQQFVLDFLMMSGLAGRANHMEFSQDYWQRIESMLEYPASIMDISGNVPMIGDADDGYVTRLSQEKNFCPYGSLLATGAILFNRGDFKKKAGWLDDKTRWLLGNEADKKFNAISIESAELPVHRQFPEGGYYIAGSDFETGEEVRVVIDAGPLGYRSIAAHGHADALAFILSISGREFLVDPGTYSYHTKQKWRDYFRGTSTHNTIRIDNENQSVIAGNFMWSKKAQARCETWKPGDRVDHFIGSHDGYSRLDDPVIHRRELRFDKLESTLKVTDTLLCKRTHTIEQFWHFSEDCKVQLEGKEILAENDNIRLFLNIHAPDVDIELCHGQEEPPLGWVSRRFDIKVPSTTAVVRCQTDGTRSLMTSLKWLRM